IGLGSAFLRAARCVAQLVLAQLLDGFVQFLLHVLVLVVSAHACPAISTVAFLTARCTKTGSAFFTFGSTVGAGSWARAALSATVRAWRMSRVSALRSRFSSSIASSIS